MTDLSMYELEDTIWDDLCHSDDHIVPRPSDDHSPFGDSHKKPHFEVTNISYNTGDRSSAGYGDEGNEEGRFSSSRKRMLESDFRSHGPSGVFSPSEDGDSTKETSSLASEKATSPSHVLQNSKTDMHSNEFYVDDTVAGERTTTGLDNNSSIDPLGDIIHTSNNLNFHENSEVKDPSDFLYYDWPEIENFEDVDRIFRSCDSTFGLGASREDELGWFSSSDNRGNEGHENSDFKTCPESNSVDHLSRNHDLKSLSSNDADMMSPPARLRGSLWISEKPESYVPFMSGPAISNGEEGFTPKAQMNEDQKEVKMQNQSVGKQKEHNFGNGSLNCTNKLLNEAVQLPSRAKSHQAFSPQHGSCCNYLQNNLSYVHSDSSPSSDLTSVNPTSSAVKIETNELNSPATRDYSAKESCYAGDKSDNHSDIEEVHHFNAAELGSSNIQESSTHSGMNDVSLEAASFRQLQLVMKQLDLRTKICIRDSLYRLARSAEQRHIDVNLNSIGGRDASGALITEGEKSLMEIETDTNPIDRSVAHLLFHRPSEAPPASAQE